FMIVSAWSFLSFYVTELGSDAAEVGVFMACAGVTSLASLPFIAPLIERHGRKRFMSWGMFFVGFSNLGFGLFDGYFPWLLVIRLLQGAAFAACFNACSTALVDLLPFEKRVQGIGLYGISGSLAVAVGPFLGETALIYLGFNAYFLLLTAFGIMGTALVLTFKDPPRSTTFVSSPVKFFPTAIEGKHLAMMSLVAVFGSGFAAMNVFFPLFAKDLGMRAGIFFTSYGITLIVVRLILGSIVDRLDKGKLILACLVGFGILLIATSRLELLIHTVFLGGLFGFCQGLSYPAMMARMLDRSNSGNRAIVVSLFTGSFGVGINFSVLVWGFVAQMKGLSFMFVFGGSIILVTAILYSSLGLWHKNNPPQNRENVI
ncbi:MAG: MFS transporter, partial [Pseudomonadota bacterium]